MRQRGRVSHALVIEELVAFGRHQAPVEAEELSELPRVVHLDALVRRLDLVQLFGGGVAVARVRVEPVEDEVVPDDGGRRRRRFRGRDRAFLGQVAAGDAVHDLALRTECHRQRVEQLLGLARVVGGEVADVDIERHAAALGPGVDREVRFGEQDGSGDAAGLAVPFRKDVPLLVDDRQLRVVRRIPAQRGESFQIRQQGCAAAAFEQIASQVKALHLRPPAGPPIST